MDDTPDTTPILDAAVAMHELFLTLVAGGFTEYQALLIVAECVTSHRRGPA